MGQLTFEKTINMSTLSTNPDPSYVEKLMIGNEPDNDIWQYYRFNKAANDKKSHITLSNYDDLDWAYPTSSMTTQFIANYGMKTFPGVGAISFFTPTSGTSKILVPVHPEKPVKFKAPTLSMVEGEGTLQFTITPPADITYTCYRVLLRRELFGYEYITYVDTIEVPKPAVNGDYTIYCVGYVDEGQTISEDSNYISYSVSGHPAPVSVFDKYVTGVHITDGGYIQNTYSDGTLLLSDNTVIVDNEVERLDTCTLPRTALSDLVSSIHQVFTSKLTCKLIGVEIAGNIGGEVVVRVLDANDTIIGYGVDDASSSVTTIIPLDLPVQLLPTGIYKVEFLFKQSSSVYISSLAYDGTMWSTTDSSGTISIGLRYTVKK